MLSWSLLSTPAVRRFGGTLADDGRGIAVDPFSGNTYITGSFVSTALVVTGTTTLGTAGLQDIYVIKLDINGAPLWGVRYAVTLAEGRILQPQ
jgi:hypothetical protein